MVDMKALRKRRERQKDAAEKRQKKRGDSELGKFEDGLTLFIVPPPIETIEVAYIAYDTHFALGKGNSGMGICLNPDKEFAALWHEETQRYLRERAERSAKSKNPFKVPEPGEECEGCGASSDPPAPEYQGALEDWKIDQGRAQRKPQYMMALVALGQISMGEVQEFDHSEKIVKPYPLSFTVWDQIMDLFYENGDITWDPDNPMILRCKRTSPPEGKPGFVEYDVQPWIEGIKNPDLARSLVDKSVRASIKKEMRPGGNGDLYYKLADMVRDHDNLHQLIMREQSDTKDASSNVEQGKPNCFEYDCEPEDEECQACPFKVDCAEGTSKRLGRHIEVPPDPGEEEAEEAEEKGSEARRRRRKPEPEPEIDEDDLWEELADKVVELATELGYDDDEIAELDAAMEIEEPEDLRERIEELEGALEKKRARRSRAGRRRRRRGTEVSREDAERLAGPAPTDPDDDIPDSWDEKGDDGDDTVLDDFRGEIEKARAGKTRRRRRK